MLNDTWVSVPTGSEDFSFKNMRKNQYEEALFRCEDERYEVDMVIDNNASAIQCLEPLCQELATVSLADGVKWDFHLDDRSLNVIQTKAIWRVYGEYGPQVSHAPSLFCGSLRPRSMNSAEPGLMYHRVCIAFLCPDVGVVEEERRGGCSRHPQGP
jgi:hypothetical protein